MLGITMYNEEGGVATLELKDGTSWKLEDYVIIDWDELNEWSIEDLIDGGWEIV
jgi:hypothetical protein